MPFAGLIPDVALGENSRIFIGPNPNNDPENVGAGADTVSLLVSKGTVSEEPATLGTGCNLTGGFTTQTRGLYDLKITATCQWTEEQNPFTNPPTLQPASETPTIWVYPDVLNQPNDYYVCPTGWCINAVVDMDAPPEGGKVTFNLSLKNQGIYGSPAYPIL